jgi:hypothetical protein
MGGELAGPGVRRAGLPRQSLALTPGRAAGAALIKYGLIRHCEGNCQRATVRARCPRLLGRLVWRACWACLRVGRYASL